MIDNPLNRLVVKRGSELPHSKLTEDDVREILRCVQLREQAAEEIKRMDARRAAIKHEMKKITNFQLSRYFGVHLRTIDKITAFENWTHVKRANEGS